MVDRRSKDYRRYQALRSALTKDIGTDAPLSFAQAALIEHAATLLLRAERIRESILAGELCDDDQLVRISNAVRRSMSEVIAETKRRAKAAAPASLEAYLTGTQ